MTSRTSKINEPKNTGANKPADRVNNTRAFLERFNREVDKCDRIGKEAFTGEMHMATSASDVLQISANTADVVQDRVRPS